MNDEIKTNVESFQVWKDGYYEGDPLVPLDRSTYHQYGFISVLHATYLRCIKPYIRSGTRALEIGPGRGAWTKGMLDAEEVWVMDTLSASHNQFYEYLSFPEHVHYVEVTDFSCEELPEANFDYMFSFGCLCHVSIDGITQYAENLMSKLRPGAQCFWMVADFEKYNHMVDQHKYFSVVEKFMPSRQKYPKLYASMQKFYDGSRRRRLAENDGHTPVPHMLWYNAGTDRTCEMLTRTGYNIIDPDVGTCNRDPIIHFEKPA